MRNLYRKLRNSWRARWRRFWLKRSGHNGAGRIAAWIACRNTAPYHQRAHLAALTPRGFIAPTAAVSHSELKLGTHVFIGDRVSISRTPTGGPVELTDEVHLYGDTFIDTGRGGSVFIDRGTHVQPGCHIHAHVANIRIGKKVEIAPNCGFYSFDHGIVPGIPIMDQPLKSKGDILIGDGAWIGYAATILQGVTIGAGAVIGAGSVVTRDIPENAIAAGTPARVIGSRDGETASNLVSFTSPDAAAHNPYQSKVRP